MFDIGFIELLICGVIALLVLGPERLPSAARAAGRWIAGARRTVSQFTSELDRQLKAEELREELRKAGDVGLEDMEKTVRGALDEAKKYEHMILPDRETRKPKPAPATRRVAEATDVEQPTPSEPAGDQPDSAKTDSNSQAASPSSESPSDNRS